VPTPRCPDSPVGNHIFDEESPMSYDLGDDKSTLARGGGCDGPARGMRRCRGSTEFDSVAREEGIFSMFLLEKVLHQPVAKLTLCQSPAVVECRSVVSLAGSEKSNALGMIIVERTPARHVFAEGFRHLSVCISEISGPEGGLQPDFQAQRMPN
jgi:hypothetical protein